MLKTLARATASPLSSIFGSGFLVIVPVLAAATGPWSPLAMAGVCAMAFAVGSVIRFNIARAEPVLEKDPPRATLLLDRASDLALVVAYVISVCLYLHILASFVLGGLGADRGPWPDLLASGVIVAIAAIGMTKGLQALDALETWALVVTLAIILLLLLGFARYDIAAMGSDSGIVLARPEPHGAWEILTIVAGTLIVVQGFETPRYLGHVFDSAVRQRASLWSQVVASAVYLAFVTLALPVVHTLDGTYGDNSLIDLVRTAASLLSVPLVLAAALSQFSAAVADTHAATGNIEDLSAGRITPRWGTLLVALGALALIWSAGTLQILAIASRAFAAYYFLQCLVALRIARRPGARLAVAALAAVLLFVTVFAVPAG
ncbi:hypothetical protein [Oceaniglobus roseus]|uniref:hypothetical protein n=1 Tax=Oceaniglobus roseus TaxID=1737570 RepID=UPI000C7F3DAF|nr:hypothetical protein [Kandeliimicrobium roseum]